MNRDCPPGPNPRSWSTPSADEDGRSCRSWCTSACWWRWSAASARRWCRRSRATTASRSACAQWSLTITLLVGAVSSPIVGRLGDGPRRRSVLLGSLGHPRPAGSVLRRAARPRRSRCCSVGRAMQGVGLALLPLAMSVARDHLDPARARSTLATLSVTAVVGVGPRLPDHRPDRRAHQLPRRLLDGRPCSAWSPWRWSAVVVPTSVHRPTPALRPARCGAAGPRAGRSAGQPSARARSGAGVRPGCSARARGLGARARRLGRARAATHAPVGQPAADARHRTVLTANVTGSPRRHRHVHDAVDDRPLRADADVGQLRPGRLRGRRRSGPAADVGVRASLRASWSPS